MRMACILGLWAAAAQALAPAFETASVKPTERGRTFVRSDPGQWTAVATLKTLVLRAYGLKDYQVAGPAFLETARYEIAAKVPAGARESDIPAMLRALLAERFGLKAHREPRELAVYALVVAKGGPKLRESSGGGEATAAAPRLVKGADGRPEFAAGSSVARSYVVVMGGSDGAMYKLWGRGETMEQLCERLAAQLNRAVVDETGLKGAYDFTLVWSASGPIVRTGPPPDQIEMSGAPVMAETGQPLAGALASQLGLRLESQKRRVEVLVVDAVQRTPSEN
jgi:uncharacterized protein (TIGR03435 family)